MLKKKPFDNKNLGFSGSRKVRRTPFFSTDLSYNEGISTVSPNWRMLKGSQSWIIQPWRGN